MRGERKFMSYQKALYQKYHPRYAEPTEYLTIDVDGVLVALRFRDGCENPDAKPRIEHALMMADNLKSVEVSA